MESQASTETEIEQPLRLRLWTATKCIGVAVGLAALLWFTPWKIVGALVNGAGLIISLKWVFISFFCFGTLMCMASNNVFTTKENGDQLNDRMGTLSVSGIFMTAIVGFFGLLSHNILPAHASGMSIHIEAPRDIELGLKKGGAHSMVMMTGTCNLYTENQSFLDPKERRYSMSINGETRIEAFGQACSQRTFNTIEFKRAAQG